MTSRRAAKRSTVAGAAARRAKKQLERKRVRRASREQRIVPQAKPRRLRPRPHAPARREGDRQNTLASELPLPRQPALEKQEIALSGPITLFLTPLLGLGLLILGVSALAGREALRANGPQALYAHRSDLVAIGFGVIAFALLCVNVAVLL